MTLKVPDVIIVFLTRCLILTQTEVIVCHHVGEGVGNISASDDLFGLASLVPKLWDRGELLKT
jgi:hypothetical protein